MPTPTARSAVLLAAIVVTALLVRVAFFAGYVGTDDQSYILAAYRFSSGDPAAFDSHWAVRSAVVLPAALVYRLLGIGPVQTAAWPLVCSLLETIVAFALGRRLFSVQVGLLAAALLAIFPLDVIFATELFPSLPVGLFSGLGLFFFLRDSDAQTTASLFLSGLSFGLATLAADIAALCLLPIAVYFIAYATRRRRYLAFGGGLVAAVSLECLLYAAVVGDPLHRWHILSPVLATMGQDALSSGFGLAYFTQPLLRLFTEQELGLYPYLLLPALIYHARGTKRRQHRFLVVWVILLFLYISYGTASPFRFAPMARLPRYYSPMTVAAMVLLAGYLATLRRPLRRTLLALLCLTSLACVWFDNGRAVRWPQRQLQHLIVSHPKQRYAVELGLLFDVLFYSGFRPPPQLTAWAQTPEQVEYLRHGPLVYRGISVIDDLSAQSNVRVASTTADGQAAIRQLGTATLEATLRPADRLYYRLLRDPLFLRVLGLTRDQHRMSGLQVLPQDHIEVYHLP